MTVHIGAVIQHVAVDIGMFALGWLAGKWWKTRHHRHTIHAMGSLEVNEATRSRWFPGDVHRPFIPWPTPPKPPTGGSGVERKGTGPEYDGTIHPPIPRPLPDHPAPPTTVHVLDRGLPLCGFSLNTPDDWPPGHQWVHEEEKEQVTCGICAGRLDGWGSL